MNFEDRIFGNIKIEDALILDLINTPSFQRLKRVNQYGGVNLIYPVYQVSRFEHSTGVWWILKSLNTSIEIQVAGLLHDIGHTAFSHMVDMAMKNKNENFHEGIDACLDKNDRIRKILNKHKIKIIEPDQCPEIKKDGKDIGADRLDYGIRDYYGAVGRETRFGLKVLENVRLKNRSIVFTDKLTAKKYALTALKAMWKVIYEPKVAVVYQSLVEVIRGGLSKGWLKKEDLKQDDQYAFGVIKKNKDKFLEKYSKIFEKSFVAKEVEKSAGYDFHHVKLRARYFDPIVDLGVGEQRLSEINSNFVKVLKKNEEIFEKRKKGVYIKISYKN